MGSVSTEDFWEQPLPPEEFERLLRLSLEALDGPDGDEMRALAAWFTRRYPTPLDRLRYNARMHRAWVKTRGIVRLPR